MSTCGEGPNPDDIEAIFPEGSSPEVRVDGHSPVCSYGLKPFFVSGMVQQLLIQHFCDPAQLQEIKLRTAFDATAWRPGDVTGLVIEQTIKWDPEKTEQRPALLLKRGGWQFQRIAIGDRAGEEMLEGTQQFAGLWSGTIVVFALAQRAGEAELLAWEAVTALQRYTDPILQYTGLHRFTPVSIGEVAAVEESKKNYAVPVTFGYTAEDAWELYEHAPRLKRVVFNPNGFFS